MTTGVLRIPETPADSTVLRPLWIDDANPDSLVEGSRVLYGPAGEPIMVTTTAPLPVYAGRPLDRRIDTVSTELPAPRLLAVGMTNPKVPAVGAHGMRFNNTTWDPEYGAWEGQLAGSAARVASLTTAAFTNFSHSAAIVTLNVTSQPGGAETLSLKLQGQDSVSGSYYDVADGGVLFTAATGLKGLMIGPGLLSADAPSGLVVKCVRLPRKFRVVVTHSASGSWTYSVSGAFLP
jgi:hypothetical protein